MFIALGLFGLVAILIMVFNEDLPSGKSGPEADQMAQKMMQSLGKETYDQTEFYSWNFAGVHRYYWDKDKKLVEVLWGDQRAVFKTDDYLNGIAFESGKPLKEEAKNEALETAWAYYCNDSFWVFAPFKVFDPGTSRSIIDLENESEGLLVSYSSGGTTPGDSYLWILDETGRPNAYKMWVSIIPIGGIKATWENYTESSPGLFLAKTHDLGIFKLEIEDIRSGNSAESISWTAYSQYDF